MTRTSTRLALPIALLLAASLSCDRVTAPAISGAITVSMTTESLEAVRVTASGATTKTITQTVSGDGPLSVNLEGLLSGSYDVSVEGLVGGQVARYGAVSGVSVTSSHTSTPTVTLSIFQPAVIALADTVKVLHFTVSYSAVQHATSYVVEWSRSHTMADASSDTVTDTTAEIVVPTEGRYYFNVRAVNATVSSGGLPSSLQTVYALQAVATVTVLPASPSIVDGTTQQFTAVPRDADNNVLVGITLFWSSSNNGVATVSQTGLVTSVSSGQATISAVAKGIPGNATLTVTPQAASKLVFTSDPTNTTAGQTIPSVKVTIKNPKGQTAASDNTTQVAIAITSPNGAVLSGTATATVANGVATFANLSINKAAVNYTLTATATSLTSGVSAQFNITPAAASQLVFGVQPSNATAGVPFGSTVEVELRDALGNRVTTARDSVTLAFGANPGSGTISGTKIVNAVSGVAVFPGISVDKAAAGYTLSASATGLPNATSSQFTITAAAIAKVAFTAQPVTVTTDDLVQATVTTTDAFGNLVPTIMDVTVAIGTNPGGGTLGGTTTLQTSGGVAAFTDLEIDKVGTGYTLVATAGVLTAAASATFNVNVGAPFKLEFESSPTIAEPQAALGAIEVVVVDAHGNPTGGNGTPVDISIAINPGGGAITGTTQQLTVGGVATFNDLSIDNTGNGYALQATTGGLQDATSTAFDVALSFVDYVVGSFHSCGLTTTGAAYCTGYGGDGQRGDGNFDAQRATPVRVAGGHTFTSLTAGRRHTCGIRAIDGFVLCWGEGLNGKLGTGDVANVNVPTPVTGGAAFTSVSAGTSHTCAIRASDSRVMCWGAAANGRLGNNLTAPDVPNPTLTTDVAAYNSVSAGVGHTCGIRSSDRRVQCWGTAANGRLGNGLTLPDVLVPSPTTNTSAFIRVSAGGVHSCGIRSDGLAFCWGGNGSGQLGNNDGTFTEQSNPVAVANSLHFAEISAGGSAETCGVTTAGTGFCWGLASFGRLGNGTDVGNFIAPSLVVGGLTFTSIRAGTTFSTCGRATNGAFCWGNNFDGQAGNGLIGVHSAIPIRVIGTR